MKNNTSSLKKRLNTFFRILKYIQRFRFLFILENVNFMGEGWYMSRERKTDRQKQRETEAERDTLRGRHPKSLQLCLTLWDPMDGP